jgi:predicted alpha-1,2-mannosidase
VIARKHPAMKSFGGRNQTKRAWRTRCPLIAGLVLAGLLPAIDAWAREPVDLADPLIGTSNSRWMLGPFASAPFGMVQLGPDNQGGGWMAGYDASIASIAGFSHIHAWTMAGLRMMPATADFTLRQPRPDLPFVGGGAAYHSRILKETEVARPGYYGVHLFDADTKVEITATTRCGFQRYTFPESNDARILIALQFPAEYNFVVRDGHIRKVGSTELEGVAHSTSGGWFGSANPGWNDYSLHFVIQFDKPMESFQGWQDGQLVPGTESGIRGKGEVGGLVRFRTSAGEAVQIRSALSLVDLDGARRNLAAELEPHGWDFGRVAAATKARWQDKLGRVQVQGGTGRDRVRFYTALFRSFARQTWNDVDGRYVDPQERVQQLPPGTAIYGGDSFWNTYWNLNGLWTLLTPRIANNWVVTQLELFDKTGWTSVGPTGIEMSGIMDVTHEVALMVAAWQKGIRNHYDAEHLYRAVKNTVTRQGEKLPSGGHAGNRHLDIYERLGYVPYDMGAACWTMDYAYTDFCVAQLAKALGKEDEHHKFIARSRNWANLYHPGKHFAVPRHSDGSWLPGYDPMSGRSWIEGNGWQYTFYTPHDVDHLVTLMGRERFNGRLVDGFEKSRRHRFAAHAFDRGQNASFEYFINHGNQPNMQAAWLFNHTGKPWLTQRYTREIMEHFYGDTPYRGWEGDEDEGQMSAWFVMSALGLFEMDGGVTPRPRVSIGSPLFGRAEIRLDPDYYPGGSFVIEAPGNGPDNVYIQSATLNGEPLDQPWIFFDQITKGGKLVLTMGPQPDKQWGIPTGAPIGESSCTRHRDDPPCASSP